jgi:hypothetical protein
MFYLCLRSCKEGFEGEGGGLATAGATGSGGLAIYIGGRWWWYFYLTLFYFNLVSLFNCSHQISVFFFNFDSISLLLFLFKNALKKKSG